MKPFVSLQSRKNELKMIDYVPSFQKTLDTQSTQAK